MDAPVEFRLSSMGRIGNGDDQYHSMVFNPSPRQEVYEKTAPLATGPTTISWWLTAIGWRPNISVGGHHSPRAWGIALVLGSPSGDNPGFFTY